MVELEGLQGMLMEGGVGTVGIEATLDSHHTSEASGSFTHLEFHHELHATADRQLGGGDASVVGKRLVQCLHGFFQADDTKAYACARGGLGHA